MSSPPCEIIWAKMIWGNPVLKKKKVCLEAPLLPGCLFFVFFVYSFKVISMLCRQFPPSSTLIANSFWITYFYSVRLSYFLSAFWCIRRRFFFFSSVLFSFFWLSAGCQPTDSAVKILFFSLVNFRSSAFTLNFYFSACMHACVA